MGLSKAFSSLAGSSIKLGRLPTLPTTEDLLFVLDTATKNKKPTELPFKNPHNNVTFNIKVAPATTQHAPLWTFTRLSESGTVILWTRESSVVSMIQGQVKIGSNSTGLIEENNTELEGQELSGSQPYVLGSASESAFDLATADEAQGIGEQDVAGQDSTWHDAADPDEPAPHAADPSLVDSYAAEPDAVWQNVTANDASRQNEEEPNVAWHGTPEHEAAWQNAAEPDTAWQNAAEPDTAWQKAPDPDAAWQNTPEHEAAWQKAKEPDVARFSRPDHEAAQPHEAGQEAARQDSAAPDLAEQDSATSDLTTPDVPLQKAAAQEATGKQPTGKKAKGKKAKARAAAARAVAAQNNAETAGAVQDNAETAAAAQDNAETAAAAQENAETAAAAQDHAETAAAAQDHAETAAAAQDHAETAAAEPDTQEQSSQSPINTQAQAGLQNDPYHGPATVRPPVVLHTEVLTNYLSSLSDPATGLLYHGAFEFFLLRDVEYVQKRGIKMSLLVFDFVDPETKESAITSTEAAAVVARIMSKSCTPLELCTQLRTGEFAILLCGYDGAGALNFAAKLCGRLPNGKNELSILATREPLAMGVACIPEHCEDPGSLIASAIEAKNLARKSQRSCMLFPLF